MDDRVATMDGHAFKTPVEQEQPLRLIREEGIILLNYYSSVRDPALRAAILDLVKMVARDQPAAT